MSATSFPGDRSSDAHAPRSAFVIARAEGTGQAVGCGAIRPLDREAPNVAELKRMYARPGTHGVGHAILIHLERTAREFAYEKLWLETGAQNRRALSFYERHGYTPVPNFGPYVGRAESICLGKELA